MVMRLGVGDAEANWNDVEERRVRELHAPAAKIVADVEDKLEPARARAIGAYQRLVRAAIRGGRNIGDKRASGSAAQLVKLDTDALSRPADSDVQDMGRHTGHSRPPRRIRRPPIGPGRSF